MATKSERISDLATDEQLDVVRTMLLRLAEEQSFSEVVERALALTIDRIQERIDTLDAAVIDLQRHAANPPASPAVQPEDPAYRQLRWTQGFVPAPAGQAIGPNDTVIQQAVQATWKTNP